MELRSHTGGDCDEILITLRQSCHEHLHRYGAN
jgi:hypothetical protein